MTERIFVICPDYGYEGLREPVAAFATQVLADAICGLMNTTNGTTHRVFEVPLWSPWPPVAKPAA